MEPTPPSKFWPIVPTPWVRESNRDRWNPRARVLRYRAFRDEVRIRHVWAPEPGDLVVFCLPIPKSWTKAKKAASEFRPHMQVPDLDNLVKALLDACYNDDAHVWALTAMKIWSHRPGILVHRRAPVLDAALASLGVL